MRLMSLPERETLAKVPVHVLADWALKRDLSILLRFTGGYVAVHGPENLAFEMGWAERMRVANLLGAAAKEKNVELTKSPADTLFGLPVEIED